MQRYFIELAYDGTDYCGWQRQPIVSSVQQTIEEALTKLNSNEEIKVMGCGRTDTGVHASHFVLHMDHPEIDDCDKMAFKLNKMLPHSIAIHSIYKVDTKAHARFHATSRTYRYFIHKEKNPFKHNQSWLLLHSLNLEEMNKASQHLLGKQDFTSLSKLHTDVKTNICSVSKASWIKLSDTEYYFEITADRFLRNMVRATVGTLVDVGLGKLNPDDIPAILEAKNRSAASTSVPACGLFLWKVEY